MVFYFVIRNGIARVLCKSAVQHSGMCKKNLFQNTSSAYKITSVALNINFDHQFSSSSSHNNYKKTFSSYFHYLLGTCIVTSGIALWHLKNRKLSADEQRDYKSLGISFQSQNSISLIELEEQVRQEFAGAEISGLPEYTANDIAKHDSIEKGVWVCFKSGVYDITDFISKHPGGEKILMAAGASLEPFWEIFAVHKTEQVLKMLEEYRIGNLSPHDRGLDLEKSEDPFASDPKRHPVLRANSQKPFNAEPPKDLLVENFITPNELFFVRNHLPVPMIDPEDYELEISGIGIDKPISLNLNDIKTKFKKHKIVATIQCAGNRRTEMATVKEVKGLNWGAGAISNAEWAGARLYDVLKDAGVNFEDKKIQHIQFEGLDVDPSNSPYGASIPADKALDPKNDVLIAYEMNGKELPRDHGYPIRLVAPGIVGARNVKWLGRIIVSDEENKSHWQAKDYKGFSPAINWDNVDFSTAPAIQELPVNSAICKPDINSVVSLKDNHLRVEGYAWSGGGRKIVRVDVSVDGGKTWHIANLVQDKSPLYKCWAWTLWNIDVPVSVENESEIQVICKAIDSSYNVQPDSFPPIWNLRGVMGNAWHRINVKVHK